MEPDAVILVVDDDSVIRDYLSSLLGASRYLVVTATDGIEALERLAGFSVDLIITDLKMPKMDGYELCRRLSEDSRYSNIPVVIISGQSERSDRVRGLELGAMDFLIKPFHMTEVIAKVRNWVNYHQLSQKWHNAMEDLGSVTDYSRGILKEFDPQTFGTARWLQRMFTHIEKSAPRHDQIPQFLMLVERNGGPGGKGCQARLIARETDDATVEGLGEWIDLGECPLDDDVYWAGDPIRAVDLQSSPEEGNTIPLHRLNSKHVPLHNFVSVCSDGALLLLGINYPGKVEEEYGHLLKAALLHHDFFRTIAARGREVEDAFLYTVGALARASAANDVETGNHLLRVNEYSALLATTMGLPEDLVRELRHFAQMHDVGKIRLSRDILLKKGKLTHDEWEEMKRHTHYGVEILGDSPRLNVARQIALSHHECWDGSGYPQGLTGDEIPLPARVVKLADAYDALRSRRAYKSVLSGEEAYGVIVNGDASRARPEEFDPAVLSAFRTCAGEMDIIFQRLSDTSDEPDRYMPSS
jgi:response regulator RpfG family c-di-GMP phosphodiesterase